MDKKAFKETALGGIISNPTFVLVLGICPLIGTSTTFINSFAMGIATTFVLICSNAIIALLRKVIPDQVRLPAYIMMIATFVTVVQLFMDKFLPGLYDAVGAFIALIVVNCIIFARAESFASKNNVFLSLVDGASMGAGFTLAICLLGGIRQFLTEVCRIGIIAQPAGGFLVLGLLMAMFNGIFYLVKKQNDKKKSLALTKEVR